MKKIRWDYVLLMIGVVSFIGWGIMSYKEDVEEQRSRALMYELRSRQEIVFATKVYDNDTDATGNAEDKKVMLVSYANIFAENDDMVAWLNIPGTEIDYPVMQTMEDEEYYLYRNFKKEKDKNGCLILDTDSDLSNATGNMIIHGHNMRSGAMFGNLGEYASEEYGKAHDTITLTTKTETRTYKLVAAFYSKIYGVNDKVFKYYNFFDAASEEEFNYFYDNIKKMRLYDTGYTAEYGKQFITLSTCAYHTSNGRFVVVAQRID